MEITGLIFDIKKYALHDGPGIRSTVFLKGCPLECRWCCNPESRSFEPEIMWLEGNCINCNLCIEICPENAVLSEEDGHKQINSALCNICGKCIERCPGEALQLVGRRVTVEEVLREIEKDSVFYQRTGGGLTLSGGEPLAQPDFAHELLRQYKKNGGIHTAIETCGHVDWKILEAIIEFTDLVYYDIKHMDTGEHKRFTGAGNELILENLQKAAKAVKRLIVRFPLIPGCNDTDDNLEKTAKFLNSQPDVNDVEILPYHRLGEPKYARMGKEYKMKGKNKISREKLNAARSILGSRGLKIWVEGDKHQDK